MTELHLEYSLTSAKHSFQSSVLPTQKRPLIIPHLETISYFHLTVYKTKLALRGKVFCPRSPSQEVGPDLSWVALSLCHSCQLVGNSELEDWVAQSWQT